MKSPLIFRIFKKDQIYVVKQFTDDDRIVIGNGAEVHIDLSSNEISPIHCLVEKRGEQYFLCDLGSAQGTFKKDVQVLDEPIESGEEFHIGPFKIVFFVGVQKSVAAPPSAPPVKIVKPVREPEPAKKEIVLGSSKKALSTSSDRPVKDLKDHLRGGTGNRVEVLVCWQERIVETYHFMAVGHKILGPAGDIVVPEGSCPKDWRLLDLNTSNNVVINTTPEMRVEVLKDGEVTRVKEEFYKLGQGEACFIQLINGMQLVVRFSPKTPAIVFDSPLILGSSEFTGLLAALIIAVLTSLIVSVYKPKKVKAEEEIERIAQVVFTKPPPKVTKAEPVAPAQTPEVKKEEEKKVKVEELKKALLLDEKKESKVLADPTKPEQEKQNPQKSGKAAEVKPKNAKLKVKMFTSSKSGGAVKTGDVDGANAQSKEPDPSNSGLLAAFGEGGARSKLDKVYSGAGELIGTAEKAKGTSGFNSGRSGEDLGTKIKDTGAGGAGTATQGISGVGTKGRNTGMSGIGNGTGFGEKDRVQIVAGGSEEAFVGSIDREAVRRVVRSANTQFRSCYEREFRTNTRLEGKIVIVWEIHELGVAKNLRVVKSTMNNTAVEDCVKLRLSGLRFPEPPPGTSAEVTFPFVFRSQNP